MLMRDVVVEGTKNVLEYARQQKVKRMLFISSGAVYGKQPSDLSHIPEDYAGAPESLNPLNAYGCAKRQAENLCAVYNHRYSVDFVVARCFAFVGSYLPLNAHFAIGNFIRDGLSGGPIIVKGDGSTIRSYLYADDLAEWLWTILMKGKTGQAYNVGSDEAITIVDLAHLVSSSFDSKPEVFIKGKLASEVNRYVPDIGKVKNELGVLVRTALLYGINKTITFNNKKIKVP
jgi:dTDP-glucose 4,6-dehydratase